MKRPLSPHLSIYSTQITSSFSILHRGTGLFLSLIFFLSIFCNDIQDYYQNNYLIWNISSIITCGESIINPIIIITSIICFSLYLHLLTGIRHLIWDLGFLFDLVQVYFSAKIIANLAFFLTFLTIFYYLEF